MHFKTVGKDMENNLFRPILVKLLFFVNRFVLDQYLIFLALMIYGSEPGTAWVPDLLPSVAGKLSTSCLQCLAPSKLK